ncbi:hypothetical protein RhiirA1_507095 [Rhizophagus irregularis]|uniref:Ion transport domain-containing protein n=1 Tax=Rhizophagus irregularis TaxID=588596 RepID=A0A2N0QTN9_9GLOM|nr:hypothetical protein RhiirA1_507095 [Rhizophagus irregularis]
MNDLSEIKVIKQHENTFLDYFKDENPTSKVDYGKNVITEKENYRIKICQDGKFAATFDTANLRIKILQNTDYRPFINDKKKNSSSNKDKSDDSVKIDKTIAYFKINFDFIIETFYSTDCSSNSDEKITKEKKSDSKEDKKNYKWSLDISNMHKKKDNKYFILFAISRIKVDEDMKGTEKNNDDKNKLDKTKYEPTNKCKLQDENIRTANKSNKGIAIYRIELRKEGADNYILTAVTRFYSNKISGICRFIYSRDDDDDEKSKSNDVNDEKSSDIELKRFIILNFRGIYSIKFDDNFDFLDFNEKFKYPQIIRFVLDNWYTFDEFSDCTNRLLTCIYDKYFVITKYISGTQSLEVYDLAKMEHEIDAKFVGNIVNEYNHYFFAVSGLLLGFTQVNTIKLFYMENGLQVASKKFDGIKKIYLLEFFDNDEKLFIIGECPDGMIKVIIWDLYDTGKHKLIELDDFPITKANIDDIYTRLAITSGNILQIDDNGNVSSVLKKVKKLKEEIEKTEKAERDKVADPLKNNVFGKQPNGKDDKNHIIYYDGKTNFKQIVNDREPWVPGGCERTSYCIYYNEEGTETETLQLIVGRSTVQIWHEIKDDSKKEDELPNKGEAFLEYIWSNRIPVKQEGKKTRLRIEKFEYGPNYGSKSKINDFYLKVYWFERSYSSKPEEHKKMTEQEIIKEEDDDIDRIEKELKQINSKDNDLNEEEKEKKRQEIINNCVKVKIREKAIQGKDVIKKSHAARHACKALEHIRKRYKNDFARKLFIRCFADQGHLLGQDPDEIIPKEYLERYNNDTKFRALIPMVKLKSDECVKLKWYDHNWIWDKFKNLKNKFKEYRNFEKSPLALRVVPFPDIISPFKIRFILLRDPINIKIKESTYSGVATNSLTNETLNIDLKSDFDPKSSDDNPFSTFNTAMEAAYFWISGNWVQRDNFSNWAVDFFTLIASIFLVIILQNILIAFMNGVYVTAGTKGKQKLLRYQANYIATFEALHVHFSDSELECEPKRIYYFSQAKNFEEWYNTKKGEQGVIYKEFEEASMFMINSIYKEIDYDKYSILTYNDNIKMIIKDFINLGNNVNVNTEDLIKRVIDKNSIDEIEGIEDIKVDLETKVRKLNYILEKLKKHSL